MLSVLAWFMGSTVGRYVAAGITGTLVIGLAVLRVFQQGRDYERSKDTERKLNELRNTVTANEEVSRLSRVDRLKYVNEWMRNGD